MTRIRITTGHAELPGTIDDTVAGRDFAALLPLTLDLADFHGIEKVADLPRRLDTTGAPGSAAAEPGDLTYYAPWGNLALFYRAYRRSEGLVRLGHVDGDLAPLTSGDGRPTVTIEPVD